MTRDEAIRASITHWREVEKTDDPFVRIGVGDCALCEKYLDTGCDTCPLGKAGYGCRTNASPYIRANKASWGWRHSGTKTAKANFHAAARAMLETLEGRTKDRRHGRVAQW